MVTTYQLPVHVNICKVKVWFSWGDFQVIGWSDVHKISGPVLDTC